MAGVTSTGAAVAPSRRPPAPRPCHGRDRPCRARLEAAARGLWKARAGGTAGAQTSAGTLAVAPEGLRFQTLRVLIFHGYLLQGTGSNVYNAELGAALVRAGHELHLVCQDRAPFALDWVDAAADWDGGALAVDERRSPARATVYRPDIGGLLPLYVADVYEGMEARPFPELSDEELARYIDANVAAVREVAARARPDVALANHLVMGPAILARALEDAPYAVKVHGSALEYTVKPHRARFRPYAAEGLARAGGVLVGSRHTAESLWAEMEDETLPGRTRLGPPGGDAPRFAPGAGDLRGLRDRLAALPAAARTGSSFDRDAGEAVAALDTIDAGDRLVVFVGKLIASKGVELLLAAWPAGARARAARAADRGRLRGVPGR